MKRYLAVLLASVIATAGLAVPVVAQNAKQVKLKDDRVLVGEVVEKDGVVTINTLDGSLFQFSRDQVDSVTSASADQVKLSAPSAASRAPAPAQEAQADKKEDAAPSVASDATPAKPEPAKAEAAGDNPVVEVKTNKGVLSLELYEDDAPNTVANFVSLVEKGFYDGTGFHRILKGFMAQGGDPNTKDESKSGMWGTGGPGYSFDNEGGDNPKRKNVRGAISMANAGPGTNGSQFFLLFKDASYLDGRHTAFGHVVSGMDVVDAIERDAATEQDGQKPREKIVIEKATVKKKRDHKYDVIKNGNR